MKLAEEDFQLRKTAATADALAWALFKSSNAEGAKEKIDQALELSHRTDAHVLHHHGKLIQHHPRTP